MLTDEQLDFFAGATTDIFQQLENDILADIARRVRKTERWTETAELQAEALREMGWSPYKIRLEVFKRLNANEEYRRFIDENTLAHKAAQQEAIDAALEDLKARCPEIFAEAGNMSFRNDLSLWAEAGKTLVRGASVDKIVADMTRRAQGDLVNLTCSLGFRDVTGAVIPGRRAYAHAMNRAMTQVVSGTMSSGEACTRAVRELARSGLRYVDYASGITRQLDTAAANALRTSVAQLTGDIMQANIEESGVEYVQVSEHWGARPSHASWQGGIYHVEQFKAICGYGDPGDPDHIYSYNCRHHHYPFWPGISEKIEYQPEPGPFEVNGKTYTYYQATQRQRSMERGIRATKREALAQEAMGDKSAVAAAKLKLTEQQANYMGFSNATNLRPRLDRLQVFGYDKSAAANARAALTAEMKRLGMSGGAGQMYRRSGNPGIFAVLPERMTKKHIREVAREYGVSLKGLKLFIDFDEDKMRDAFHITGRADPFDIGRIDFFPKAFRSREELLRTLYHERLHVLQFREFGGEHVQLNRAFFEELAYADENAFIEGLRREGRL